MNDDLLQRLGSFATMVLSLILGWVAFQFEQWCKYGRETALIVAAAFGTLGLIRLGRTELGLYDVQTASVFNAYITIAYAAILVVVVGLHYVRHRYLREHKC